MSFFIHPTVGGILIRFLHTLGNTVPPRWCRERPSNKFPLPKVKKSITNVSGELQVVFVSSVSKGIIRSEVLDIVVRHALSSVVQVFFSFLGKKKSVVIPMEFILL
jgi:hypothetical protein